ncbi:hypothetical protein VMCG_00287 [Cytospora schulzeri]|uniref:RING-type domain-containing protein n=1 Tax=Cytospora schulzeri TaxID=448051 RepID=A0A423X8K0_9PEZI|nr:hypothetical protein VMCG_00287 [Valsa malicola]
MDSSKPGLDLEKELTCSICTELLYHPLTLLDCLHTFCGACLTDWFSWQANAAENAPTPPAPGTPVFTCPSCRATVRDTRHNATVASLLDMILVAHPEKMKPDAEKEEMNAKYRPGDKVLPELNLPERTAEQLRLEEQERNLIDSVRQISLQEAVNGGSSGARSRRLREPSHSRNGSSHRAREAKHQSSLRSLISSSDAADIDMEREVEEFARQIQEEGLLDGLDLDNLDLTNNDELSRKITEAYRRRQRERERLRYEARERSRASSRHSYSGPSDARQYLGSSSNLAGRPTEHRSRSPSAASQSEEYSRPPISSRSTHLDVHESRRRRRTASKSRDRSSTLPAGPTQPEPRSGTRSQTDSDLRSNSLGTGTRRPVIPDGRSASTSDVPGNSNQAIVESPAAMSLPFSARASGLNLVHTQERSSSESSLKSTRPKPTDIVVQPPSASPPPRPNQSLLATPPSGSGHPKLRAQLFPEPAIKCNSCGKEHIEYELHYHCEDCDDGSWNICLNCYRLGKGCHHWFGFGYGGYTRWERLRKSNPSLPEPHKLLASRYLPPKSMVASAAEDRKAWSSEDPYERLQSGTFCAQCLAWSNECYWRCDLCNEGDWGFCNDCVLTFITTCDLCRQPIAPTQSRLHCFTCVSSIVPDSRPGDYDICEQCYNGLVLRGGLSAENGPEGWRRCPAGHRMVVIGFKDGKGGQRRYTVKDLVGGRRLQGDKKVERLVSTDVSATVGDGAGGDALFPPDGGFGWKAFARWAWYPAAGATDELMFPKGAEITEIEDANGEWYHGVYMGAKGLFPAPYVRILK